MDRLNTESHYVWASLMSPFWFWSSVLNYLNVSLITTLYICNITSSITPSDSHAMAGMALQCLKDEGTAVKDAGELDRALSIIKQRLLDSKRADGHMGNEFSTGLAVQVRIKTV